MTATGQCRDRLLASAKIAAIAECDIGPFLVTEVRYGCRCRDGRDPRGLLRRPSRHWDRASFRIRPRMQSYRPATAKPCWLRTTTASRSPAILRRRRSAWRRWPRRAPPRSASENRLGYFKINSIEQSTRCKKFPTSNQRGGPGEEKKLEYVVLTADVTYTKAPPDPSYVQAKTVVRPVQGRARRGRDPAAAGRRSSARSANKKQPATPSCCTARSATHSPRPWMR